MDTEPLEALLANLSTGDPAAAEKVFLSYEPYLRRVIRRQLSAKLRAKFDSVDILQSIWADLLRDALEGDLHFRDANHLRAFLIRVVQNRFHDRVRKHRIALQRERPLAGIESTDFAKAPQPTPSDILQADDLWEQMLALCPPGHHELLKLKREGIPVPEIAARTGLHPGSIRRILRDLARKIALQKKPLAGRENP
jgi:RNA polymerase sigma-70 factor (ECF subfamily)